MINYRLKMRVKMTRADMKTGMRRRQTVACRDVIEIIWVSRMQLLHSSSGITAPAFQALVPTTSTVYSVLIKLKYRGNGPANILRLN